MPHFINPAEEDHCVFLTYEGKLAPLEIVAARYEANGLLEMKHWSRMVVDITELRSIPTALELFTFARGLSSDLPTNARVALVIRPEQSKHARLFETVARNDGVLLTLFSGVENATAWVKAAKPHEQTRPRPTDKLL